MCGLNFLSVPLFLSPRVSNIAVGKIRTSVCLHQQSLFTNPLGGLLWCVVPWGCTQMQRGMVSSGVAADTKGLLRSGKLQLRVITLYILQCIWVELICVWMCVKEHSTQPQNRYMYFCIKIRIQFFCNFVLSVAWCYIPDCNSSELWRYFTYIWACACVPHITKSPQNTFNKNSSLNIVPCRCANSKCVCASDHADSLGSPLQISLRPDANCRVMYGLDGVAASLVVQPD